MHVVMGWFSRRALPSSSPGEAALFGGPAAKVAQALDKIVPSSYKRHSFGGADWGVIACEVADPGPWLWPVVAAEGPVTTISLGVPVGLTGPASTLGPRLLAGEDIQAMVAPPFAVVALDGDHLP